MKITTKNWTFCHLASDDLIAQITFGGKLNSRTGKVEFIYYVTVLKSDSTQQELEGESLKDFAQFPFTELNKAIENINHRYAHWQLIDRQNLSREKASSGSGCSSCAAH